MTDLSSQAEQILRDNDRGGFTVPTSGLYPFQWLWDAGFTALGWATFDEPRAWQELEVLFRGQWSDGMLPHIVFHKFEPTYFPGPEVWGTKHDPMTSGITQPPVIATVARMMLESAKDQTLAMTALKNLYPKMLAFHRWLHTARDPNNTGLVSIVHPWEAGCDNSPAWDEALARVPVDPNLAPYKRRDTSHVDAAQRPQQHEYDRYLSLVMGFKNVAYDPAKVWQSSKFRVAGEGFNAILCRADRDLLYLAQVLQEPTSELEQWTVNNQIGLERLWDETAGIYFSFDQISNQAIRVPTSAGFLPLFAGGLSQTRVDQLAARLEAMARHVKYLIPSTDPTHQAFESKRYWRGPIWLVVNWMIARGFIEHGRPEIAERIRTDSLELIKQAGFAEYFEPNTAEGLGGLHFSWTAAMYLVWLKNE